MSRALLHIPPNQLVENFQFWVSIEKNLSATEKSYLATGTVVGSNKLSFLATIRPRTSGFEVREWNAVVTIAQSVERPKKRSLAEGATLL